MNQARRNFSLSIRSKKGGGRDRQGEEEGEESGNEKTPRAARVMEKRKTLSAMPMTTTIVQCSSPIDSSSSSSEHFTGSNSHDTFTAMSFDPSSSSTSTSAYASISGVIQRKRVPSDASTGMQATSAWFNGSNTDDDRSMPSSPTGSDWPAEAASLLERARDALASGKAEAKEERGGTMTNLTGLGVATSFPLETIIEKAPLESKDRTSRKQRSPKTKTRASTLPSGSSEASIILPEQLARQNSKSGGSFLNRLKRISKREKRAATESEVIVPEPVKEVHHQEKDQIINTADDSILAIIPSSFDPPSGRLKQIHPPLRAMMQERLPQLTTERLRPVQSVQPSLADDEDIAEREEESLAGDDDWYEPDTPIEDRKRESTGESAMQRRESSITPAAKLHHQYGNASVEEFDQSIPGSFMY